MSGPKKIEVPSTGNILRPGEEKTITNTATKLKVSRQTVYNMIEDGRLSTTIRDGRTYCIV